MDEVEKENLDMKDSNWKNKDEQYLFELQKFLDISENIQDEELKKEVIAQMLKCDRIITKLAEDIFQKLEKK